VTPVSPACEPCITYYVVCSVLGHIACMQCVRCSVVCLSVCVSVLFTWMYPAKAAEPIVMPFGGSDSGGPRTQLLDGVEIPMGRGIFGG